jgi:hypothetical protein
MGAGLHGYTPIRILPVVVVLAVVLFIIHPQARSKRIRAVNGLLIVALISLIVFLPLGRFALENPDIFLFRSISRFGSIERNIPGNPIVIFLSNLWNAMTMFAWDDGEIWVTSVPGRPALDFISAALFYLGMTALMVRYLRRRFWIDLFLLLAVPFLLMPSILSLAFPAENPSLNRMGGAIVPVFIISALALDGLLSTIERWWPKRKLLIWGGLSVLLLLISAQNFELVFNRYRQIYENSSWNTSEMGAVIQSFANSVGNPDTAWVMAYPHWVDTRLVGINAGYTLRDYAITTDRLDETRADRRTKLFLVKPDDTEGLRSLQTVYPDGLLKLYESKVENHDFYMYFVPSDDL